MFFQYQDGAKASESDRPPPPVGTPQEIDRGGGGDEPNVALLENLMLF